MVGCGKLIPWERRMTTQARLRRRLTSPTSSIEARDRCRSPCSPLRGLPDRTDSTCRRSDTWRRPSSASGAEPRSAGRRRQYRRPARVASMLADRSGAARADRGTVTFRAHRVTARRRWNRCSAFTAGLAWLHHPECTALIMIRPKRNRSPWRHLRRVHGGRGAGGFVAAWLIRFRVAGSVFSAGRSRS
jgi:hypothetical protein